jgi:hypothetical protein
MYRTRPCGTQPPPLRTRALVIRPFRLTAAGLTLFALAAALTLLFAASAHASVWVIPSSARAFSTTTPGTRHEIALNAAGNEYEGVQVVLRGGGDGHAAVFSWSSDSDPLITGNTRLHRVYYVHVTRPTTDLHAKAGYYPDPLVPREFGRSMTLPGSTTSFYLLTHVPYGTPPGTYAATLHVQNGTTTVDLPMTLRVWNFGWTRIDVGSSWAMSARDIGASLAGSGIDFTGATKRRILQPFFQMMLEHGVTPNVAQVWPKVTTAGHVSDAGAFATNLTPLLGDGGLAMQDTQLPWLNWFPWSRSSYGPSSVRIANYLADVSSVYKRHGWEKKAYAYILDEPVGAAAERKAEAYARALHAASKKSGFRLRFLLTDDPRPKWIIAKKAANTFLYDDVDIWVPRYYYFFGRISSLSERRAAGKEIWWYTYANRCIAKMPNYVIEKPFTDERVWGWLMYRWKVDGLLNWGFNDWGKPLVGGGWRDPYKNPLSSLKRDGRGANGDICLVYPGYYPRYGLTDPYAPPVSSLRLEALRDGLEEREYLKLAGKTGPGSAAFVSGVIKNVTWYPYKIRYGNVFDFPKYATSTSVYAAARLRLANRIETYQGQ